MAEEEKEEVKKKKGIPPALLKAAAFGIGGFVLIVGAAAVAFIVAKSVKPPKLEFHPEREREITVVKEYRHYDIGEEEPFIAHLADLDEPHLIKAKIILAHDPRYKRLPMEIAKKKFQIRDIINTALISKTSRELATVEGKKALERELITKINRVLTTGKIERIFMEYVVQ